MNPKYYKNFSNVYGTQTSEKFHPSKEKKSETSNLPQSIFNSSWVREFVECDFYDKTYCIYSISVLTKKQIFLLQFK